MNDIHERLRDRLEMMATGYPATANGVEIKILRQLFSEEDADLFLKMEARSDKKALAKSSMNLGKAWKNLKQVDQKL
jgi:hypothetical protein